MLVSYHVKAVVAMVVQELEYQSVSSTGVRSSLCDFSLSEGLLGVPERPVQPASPVGAVACVSYVTALQQSEDSGGHGDATQSSFASDRVATRKNGDE